MSITLNVNGTDYFYPESGDVAWGPEATSWASAVTTGMLQKSGGLFQLLGEVDFGSAFGIKALSYKSRTANVASAGILRLARVDEIVWRNEANDANLVLAVNASDELTFGGAAIQFGLSVADSDNISLSLVSDTLTATIIAASIVNADISASAAIAYSKLNLAGSIVNADVNASAAIVYSKLSLTDGIVNADINAAAAIAYSKLSLTGGIVNADVNASAAIVYSKLSLTNSIVNADVASAAAIVRSKIASGTNYRILANSSAGVMSENAALTANYALYADANGQLASEQYAATVRLGSGTANTNTYLRGDNSWQSVTVADGTITYLKLAAALAKMFAYRRPNLTHASATTIDVEANTGTANETRITFPDGDIRDVTENTSSTSKYRRFIITETAEFISGTENSGLLSGLTEAASTSYSLYAVKSQINAANFVLVGTTTECIQSNFSSLNSSFGTNGWVYLGVIRNNASSNLLEFIQCGAQMQFTSGDGIPLASATATSLTWNGAFGTGANVLPNNAAIGYFNCFTDIAATARILFQSAAGGNSYGALHSTTGAPSGNVLTLWIPSVRGVVINDGVSTSKSIICFGWFDRALGEGINPII